MVVGTDRHIDDQWIHSGKVHARGELLRGGVFVDHDPVWDLLGGREAQTWTRSLKSSMDFTGS